MKFGLKNSVIDQINSVFTNYDNVEKVIIYGSRAKGTHKKGSDIDFVIKGQKLNLSLVNKISLALDDLFLPYTFDISIFTHIKNPDLLDHIERKGKVFYKRIKTSQNK